MNRWSVAPYFLVDDVVATANYYRDKLGFSNRNFDVEDCNGYRICFGSDMEK